MKFQIRLDKAKMVEVSEKIRGELDLKDGDLVNVTIEKVHVEEGFKI